ncbi:hypothetical protein [Neobacillus bataviensis]|uniref:hypothetical protein n=1 Tax=Neobacillus bataviensis TaxID=220685 RepID=UPI001CBC64A1|nr:hypothetical protein [Neobacillus bataviensis]
MKSRNSLIFIGEKKSKKNLQFTRKPSFYDAILLSNQSPQSPKAPSYQSIPLDSKANIQIHFYDSSIHLIYQKQSLKIFSRHRHLTETEVFDLFHHFAVKEGDKVSFLSFFPSGKASTRKRKKVRVLSEEKELEEDEVEDTYI